MQDLWLLPMPYPLRTKPSPRGSNPWRLLVTALCVLVAWGAQIAHYALVSHTVCADHGRLVHASELSHRDGHAHAAHAPTDSARASKDQASDRLDNGEADEHEHDHCAFLGEHQSHAVHGELVVAQQWLWSLTDDWQPCSWVSWSAQRYMVAPKNSPPLAG